MDVQCKWMCIQKLLLFFFWIGTIQKEKNQFDDIKIREKKEHGAENKNKQIVFGFARIANEEIFSEVCKAYAAHICVHIRLSAPYASILYNQQQDNTKQTTFATIEIIHHSVCTKIEPHFYKNKTIQFILFKIVFSIHKKKTWNDVQTTARQHHHSTPNMLSQNWEKMAKQSCHHYTIRMMKSILVKHP